METIRGRTSQNLNFREWKDWLANYNRIILDLGTGDGRYARSLAQAYPRWFVIGMDPCRENLREHSRAKLQNLLFVIASAQDLPREIDGLISHITINFPWGSLLEGLLAADGSLMNGLEFASRADATIDLRLNGGALAEAGSTLEAGAYNIHNHLRRAGWDMKAPVFLEQPALRAFPSTWAKRLAFGRDPRAILLTGRK